MYKVIGLIVIIIIPFLWFSLIPQNWMLGPLMGLSDEPIPSFIQNMNLISMFMILAWPIAIFLYVKKVM